MDEQQNIIIYRTADGKASVALYAKDGKIWLNQQQMARIIMWYSTLCISYFFLQNIWNLTFFCTFAGAIRKMIDLLSN